MEELEQQFEQVALVIPRFREQCQLNLENFNKKLLALKNSGTPVKAGKRPKHIGLAKSSIEEEDEEVDSSIRSEDQDVKRPLRSTKIRALNSFRQTSSIEDDDKVDNSMISEGIGELRPIRTARLKAVNSLKEPSVRTKLRQPSPPKIKQERRTADMKENRPPKAKSQESVEEPQSQNSTKRPTEAAEESPKKSTEAPEVAAKKVKLSVEEIPVESVKIELLSDDEIKMPPPAAPPKKRGRPKRNADPENEASLSQEQERPVRLTRTKSNQKSKNDSESQPALMNAVVKVEKLSETFVSKATQDSTIKSARNSASSEVSSVYEDAVQSQKSPQEEPQQSPSPAENATFAKPKTPFGTSDATFSVAAMDGTYVVPPTTTPNPHDSIMTEDQSDDDEPLRKPAPLAPSKSADVLYKNGKPVSKTKELFNPSMPSPVKARVQAFEKMAASPAMSRIPAKTAATPGDSRPSRLGQKYNTPGKLQVASSVPMLFTKPMSASKMALSIKKTGAIPKQRSMSRDNSADRAEEQRAAQEEKKKKREEKQRLVQQQREQLALEKRLKAEAILREKEERLKKHKVLMDEQLKHQKMQSLQEQKREELSRLEHQRKLEQQHLEAIRQKHNESLQRKALQRQMHRNRAERHEFDILDTDDSTDDEGKMNKKKPNPPSWASGSHKRKMVLIQSHTPLPVIDSMFSVQPRTVDLKEIFPKIEPGKLKRNSSAVWRTPPRYSTMPKF